YQNVNFRVGADWFLDSKSTIGVLVSGNQNQFNMEGTATNSISNESTPEIIDSVLIANNITDSERKQFSYNLNFARTLKKGNLNMDLDYATFSRYNEMDQPNRYYGSNGTDLLTEILSYFSLPT